MKRLIKHYFIPHPENNHQPHILRLEKTLFFIGTIVFIETLFLIGVYIILPTSDFFATILPNVLVYETNISRSQVSLPSLAINTALEKAAELKAHDMAQKGYFAHTSPEGITPWHWLNEANYKFAAAGENLAVNFFDSKDVAQAWMNSPLHKANILNEKFTEIGIATAQGIYNGQEAVFVVQFFGRPTNKPSTAKLPGTIAQAEIIATPQPQAPHMTYQEQLFVEIEHVQSPLPATDSTAGTTLIAASPLERLVSSPRVATNIIYITLASLIGLALMLKIFIKVNIQYPRLIVNGIFILIVIASSLLLNYYIALNAHIV